MILGVNGIRLLGQRSGVGRCIEALLKSFDEVDHPFSEVRVYTPAPLPADVVLPAVGRSVVANSGLSPGLWEQIALPRLHGKRDLLLCPSYIAPWVASCPTLLIHHGSYEGYPDAFGWWPRTRARVLYGLSAHRATQVSTVSEHSRRDIVRFYGVSPRKISVIPDGVDTKLFRPIEDAAGLADWRRRRVGEDAPFLLYVGKPTRRRNLRELLEAFALLKRGAQGDLKLVFVGVDLESSGLGQDAARLAVSPDVIGIAHLSHEELALAYNAATLFVYPSSYEGFGMPVLEAMASGTPAIALDNTAFPEFAGGVAKLLPDAGVETLREGIEALLGDSSLRERMAAAGPARAARYDWPIIARQYVELMTRIVTASGKRPGR
jgi:glycosyltransferase involved in cell wall biosynthesis